MLVEAMEKFSRPEWRAVPCDERDLAALRAQLARPAAAYPAYGSRFSLRTSAPDVVGHSPAICSRGLFARSMPRSLFSSRRT